MSALCNALDTKLSRCFALSSPRLFPRCLQCRFLFSLPLFPALRFLSLILLCSCLYAAIPDPLGHDAFFSLSPFASFSHTTRPARTAAKSSYSLSFLSFSPLSSLPRTLPLCLSLFQSVSFFFALFSTSLFLSLSLFLFRKFFLSPFRLNSKNALSSLIRYSSRLRVLLFTWGLAYYVLLWLLIAASRGLSTIHPFTVFYRFLSPRTPFGKILYKITRSTLPSFFFASTTFILYPLPSIPFHPPPPLFLSLSRPLSGKTFPLILFNRVSSQLS